MYMNDELAGMRPVSGAYSLAVLYSFSGHFHGTSAEYETNQGMRPRFFLSVA